MKAGFFDLYPCVFSPCHKYRYTLECRWGRGRPAMWIGLNPSTADTQKLDPTLRRIREFTKKFGFSAFVMTNLFAWRATVPTDMMMAAEPVGKDNDEMLLQTADKAGVVIAAWGTDGCFRGRDESVSRLLHRYQLNCVEITKHGHPRHPLYVKGEAELIMFRR